MSKNFWKADAVTKRAGFKNSLLDYNPRIANANDGSLGPQVSSAVRGKPNKMALRPDAPKVVARKVK